MACHSAVILLHIRGMWLLSGDCQWYTITTMLLEPKLIDCHESLEIHRRSRVQEYHTAIPQN